MFVRKLLMGQGRMLMDKLETHAEKNGLQRLWNAFNYSLHALVAAAFRQEAILALFLIPIALFLPFVEIGEC